MASEQPDAIVVGSGAGGATAARVLTARGMRVTVLEKGDWATAEDFLPLDELHFHTQKALIPHVNDDPNMYVGIDGTPKPSERWWIANMVGGSTMIWDANLPRYTPEDMAITQYMPDIPDDASMVDWPWTYEEFLPYFEKAEHEWGVSGKANQAPAQEPMSPGYEYPMPPLRLHAATEFLMEAFGKAGWQPYLGPRAINSQVYDSRPACSFCGFNQFYGCALNARGNAANTMIPRALSTGRCELLTRHCVTRLVHEDGHVTGVMYKTEPDGEEQFMGAPRVFVSVQTIESARLFLLSEIPDPNDMIGHYLIYHVKGNADLTFPGKPVWDKGPAYQPRTGIGSLQVRDLYTIDDPNTNLSKGGKFSVYDPLTTTTPIRLIKLASMGRDKMSVWGDDLADYVGELREQGGVSFSFTGEAMSVHDNRVELDPDRTDPWGMPSARTYYRHHQYDLDLSRYALERVCELMSDAGGEVRRFDPQAEENPGYGHVQGTLRAGSDPGSSVLDELCQSHTVKGLHVLDAAWMPTSGASNPTITLIANAYRVCEEVQ